MNPSSNPRYEFYSNLSKRKKAQKAEAIPTFYKCQLSCYDNILADPKNCEALCERYFVSFFEQRKYQKMISLSPLSYLIGFQILEKPGNVTL